MSRSKTNRQQKAKEYNGTLVRGLKPEINQWLDKQKTTEKPTRPAVIRGILEEERRRQSGNR